MDPEALVLDYLGRLEEAASSLTAERRAELVGDVRGHIELAVAEAGRTDEATVRGVLERLGSPYEIVAAEAGIDGPTLGLAEWAEGAATANAATARSASVPVENIALVMLTLGAVVLPFIGPVLGLRFVWLSARWTEVQKRTAALIVVVLLLLPAIILVPWLASGEITSMITTGSFLFPLVPLAGIVAAGYLVASTHLEVALVLRRR